MSDYMAQLLQNPPDSTAKVRRYYQNDAAPGGMRLDPLGPWMLTSDHDTALAERDARIEALEAGLRKIVARWPSTTNPNCDDYERGYGQATSDIAQIARALLATTHNQESVK